MQTCLKGIASSMLALIGAGLLLAGFGASEVRAADDPEPNRFEYTYGGGCQELGRGGVQAVLEGGFIAVGETRSNADDCSKVDIYVVRTFDNGRLLWSKSYDIGGGDYALSVREVLCDPAGKGGFIITGYTENTRSECGTDRDLFLLRIDRCGEVVWARTYGTKGAAEIGWDVVEACTPGEKKVGTSYGDFIAAGYTTRTKSGSGRDGYLVRARWDDGSLIWDATYDGPNQKDDYFRAVDETWYGNQDKTGDIIAAGASSSYDAGGYDAWIVRVDGNSGRFTGGNHAAVAYGKDGFEELHSIQELKYSAHRSDIVAAGTTTSISGGRDVYVLETTAYPCKIVRDMAFGDFGKRADEANWIREVTFDSEEARKGQLVLTGYMNPYEEKGHGKDDAFLHTLWAGSLEPVTGTIMLYGGEGVDWGWSVAPTWSEALKKHRPDCVSRGYIVAGFTNSFGGGPNQLYLIRTDENLRSHCEEREYEAEHIFGLYKPQCKEMEVGKFGDHCGAHVQWECQRWEEKRCLDREEACDIERCECSPFKPNVPGSGQTGQGVLSISSYPNPVKGGGSLTLEYTLADEARVNVTVSDINGRMIYMTSVAASSGAGTLSVGTEGWGSGSYMVSIAANGRIASTRVVVTE